MQPLVTVLKRRADFVAASKSGLKFVKPTVVVQSRRRKADEISISPIRIGFTATKTIGNAVVRNCVKRRLRAAVTPLIETLGLPGCDYVFIGRGQTFTGSFDDLIRDLKHALKRLADMMKA